MDREEEERYGLALERLGQIHKEHSVPVIFRDFFQREASFLIRMDALAEKLAAGEFRGASLEELEWINHGLYAELLPGAYEECYGNPAYASSMLGEDYGRYFSFLYAELRGMIVFAYEGRKRDMLWCMELFLECYHMFEEEEVPAPENLRQAIYWYVSD